MKYKFISSAFLKIVAMITMVIDHIAAYLIPTNLPIYIIFRIIGRISFPLFAFMISEGMRYSKKPLLYLGRIFILDVIINLGYYIMFNEYMGLSLLTFVIGGLIIYFLEHKNILFKFIAIIPFSIGLLTGFLFFPLKMQYGPYGMLIILIFYFSRKIAQLINKLIYKNNEEKTPYIQEFSLIISFVLYFVITYLTVLFRNQINNFFTDSQQGYQIQSFSILCFIFLLFYNGKKGYSSKWFQYSCYLFFPVHFVLLFLIKITFGL